MTQCGMLLSARKLGGMRWTLAALLGVILLSGCATMTSPDAGCNAYAEARLAMPDPAALDDIGAWGLWVADTDDRMTGTCR